MKPQIRPVTLPHSPFKILATARTGFSRRRCTGHRSLRRRSSPGLPALWAWYPFLEFIRGIIFAEEDAEGIGAAPALVRMHGIVAAEEVGVCVVAHFVLLLVLG
jgi:hypothetical protein